jgi:hypothetical protein
MSEKPHDSPPHGEMLESTYGAYLEERNRLIDAEKMYGRDFDRYIIALSGGAIALSLAFLKDLVGERPPQCGAHLWLAWILLVASIVTVVIGLWINPIAQRQFVRILDTEAALGGQDYWRRVRNTQRRSWLPVLIKLLNVIGVVSFGVGILFLLSFSFVNVRVRGVSMCDTEKDPLVVTPAQRAIQGSLGPVMGPVDRVTTVPSDREGRAGSPPALGPVDRVTVTPVSPPASQPTGDKPTSSPERPRKTPGQK